jgi:hypothetical protein
VSMTWRAVSTRPHRALVTREKIHRSMRRSLEIRAIPQIGLGKYHSPRHKLRSQSLNPGLLRQSICCDVAVAIMTRQ